LNKGLVNEAGTIIDDLEQHIKANPSERVTVYPYLYEAYWRFYDVTRKEISDSASEDEREELNNLFLGPRTLEDPTKLLKALPSDPNLVIVTFKSRINIMRDFLGPIKKKVETRHNDWGLTLPEEVLPEL
jgi:hypothetical protein